MTFDLGPFDLDIEGGTIITPSGRERLHMYIEGERIAALTGERHSARTVVDASGLYVMPGMVDTHVHLMDPADTTREDFPKGTAAAARAGVTTIVEHTHGGPIRTPEDLREKREYLASRSRVDFGLAAHVWPDRLDRTYRLSPRKGKLVRGADADVIIVDPHKRWTVTDSEIASGAGWSPFSGQTLVGRVVKTYVRGVCVAEEGRLNVDPGYGKFIAGPGSSLI